MKRLLIAESELQALARAIEIIESPARFGCVLDLGKIETYHDRVGSILNEAKKILFILRAKLVLLDESRPSSSAQSISDLLTTDVLQTAGIERESHQQIVAIGCTIMRGAEHLGMARSHTMAKRIARALNQYHPNRRGC